MSVTATKEPEVDIAVSMHGAVGDDRDREELKAALETAGVSTEGVRTIKKAKTGTAHITLNATADSTVITVARANGTVGPSRFSNLPTQKPDHLLLQLEIPLVTVENLIRCARDEGVPVLLNAAPVLTAEQSLDTQIYPLVDHFVVNEIQANNQTNKTKPLYHDKDNPHKHYLSVCDVLHDRGRWDQGRGLTMRG